MYTYTQKHTFFRGRFEKFREGGHYLRFENLLGSLSEMEGGSKLWKFPPPPHIVMTNP